MALALPDINSSRQQSRRNKAPSPVHALPPDAGRRLVEAVRHGELQTVRRLLRAGADANSRDMAGNTVAQM